MCLQPFSCRFLWAHSRRTRNEADRRSFNYSVLSSKQGFWLSLESSEMEKTQLPPCFFIFKLVLIPIAIADASHSQKIMKRGRKVSKELLSSILFTHSNFFLLPNLLTFFLGIKVIEKVVRWAANSQKKRKWKSAKLERFEKALNSMTAIKG